MFVCETAIEVYRSLVSECLLREKGKKSNLFGIRIIFKW